MHADAQTVSVSFDALRSINVREVRRHIRSGDYTGHTAGLALGYLQCNLAILPASFADDFLNYCIANPRPCPLMGMSEPGVPMIPYLGGSIDLRTDVSGYNVYRLGELVEQRHEIVDYWTDELVAFALGCSFTFERAIMKAGVSLRHIEEHLNVPMYRTSIETAAAGPFSGGMVVSMRPIKPEDIPLVTRVSAQYGHAHGAPVHQGEPASIGIADLSRPDWGDPTSVCDDEVPVFWACGVTPQSALEQARPPLCITHTPGCMLLTDVPEDAAPIESPFYKSQRERTNEDA